MKRFVITLFILVAIGALGYYIWSNYSENKSFYSSIDEFSQLLNDENFEEAKKLYDNCSDNEKANYNLSLNIYIDIFLYSLESEPSPQVALDKLYEFNTIGYSSDTVESKLIYYEKLIQSNYSFTCGMEYYDNHDYETAVTCFQDVISYDKDYETAQNLITDYRIKKQAFIDANENNEYGKSPYPNSITYKDGFIYLPIKINNAYCIIKIDEDNNTSTAFPITSTSYSCVLSSINVIGEHMYFIFGENTGEGTLLESPYAIYEMKTDGTNLRKVYDGDFFDLIFHKDKFYALSYTKGLVEIDASLTDEKIISDEIVVYMQPDEDGIYYTVKNDTVYDSIHTFYLFDGEKSENLDTNPTITTSVYDKGSIIYYSTEGLNETLYFKDMSSGGSVVNYITSDDILNVYGKLGDTVLYTSHGKYGQEVVFLHSLEKHKSLYQSANDELFGYNILGICDETQSIVLSNASSISIADASLNVNVTIPFPIVNNSTLEENQTKVALLTNEDLYTEDETVITEDDFWYYSSEDLNVRVEKRFIDELECNVYITHIRTTDANNFKIAYSEDPLPKTETSKVKSSEIAKNNSAVWAINSDPFYNPDNSDWGIVIRDGNLIKNDMDKDVLAFYSDGSLLTHRYTYGVNTKQLLEDGVIDTFSYGPILVEDGLITYDCFTSSLYDYDLRSAIGMVDTNHFVTIVADGNLRYKSRGLTLYSLAKLFINEGCSIAYNLEGGEAASAIFMGEYINHYNETTFNKSVTEICCFGESSSVK